jgi:hypothetical protein
MVRQENFKDVQTAIEGREVWYERIGIFNSDIFIHNCQGAGAVNLEVLIVDIDCTDPVTLIKGLRIYRSVRPTTRIVLLALGRVPGDQTIAALLPLRIWDIIAPEIASNDDVDEEEEESTNYLDPDSPPYLSMLLKQQLTMEANYANIARWDTQVDEVFILKKDLRNNEKVSGDKTKSISLDLELITHIQTMDIEPSIPRERIIYQDRIVGTSVIAVAGSGRRTGCTHTSIQIAKYLTSLKHKTALIEIKGFSPSALSTLATDLIIDGGFKLDNIDCYPHATQEDLVKIMMQDYTYIVLDMGALFNESGESNSFFQEYVRANLNVITTGTSLWDMKGFYMNLDFLFKRNWSRKSHILLNYCDSKLFRELIGSLSKKEKEQLLIEDFHHVPLDSDPLHIDGDFINSIIESVLPKKNKKRWFGGS